MSKQGTKWTKVNPDVENQIAEHYMQTGASSKIIAAKFGVSESKVNDITSKALNEFKNQKSKK